MRVRQSDLALWGRCPLAYRYTHIDKLPRQQSGALTFGTIIHDCVLWLEVNQDLEGAVARFKRLWIDPESLDPALSIDYFVRGTNWRKYQEQGEKILRDWWPIIQWDSDVVLGREYPFDVPIGDGHVLHGTIDKLAIRFVPKINRRVLLVSDYKCLDPDSPVHMADGSVRAARDVRVGDLVIGASGSTLVPTAVTDAFDNGVRPRYRITTRGGRVLTVTDTHPFLTQRGWIQASDLTTADVAVVGLDWDAMNQSGLSEDEAWLLGFLVGDGGLTDQVRFSTRSEAILARVTRVFEEMGCVVKRCDADYRVMYPGAGPGSKNASPHLRFIEKHGLRGVTSLEKRVPPAVMTGGRGVWSAFLAGYFDADGAIREPDRDKFASDDLHIASSNLPLLRDAQTLAAYLGIRASIYSVSSAYRGEPYTSWRLGVRDQHGCHVMASTLAPQVMHERKALRLEEVIRQARKAVRAESYVLDPIKSIERLLDGPTIGLTVSTGTHLTGGLITHNTNSKAPTYDWLADNLQFTAYSYATTQPEFWTGMPYGEDLFERVSSFPRHGEWVQLRGPKRMDAGERNQVQYNRLIHAVNALSDSVAMRIFVPNISGESCRWCEFRANCGLEPVVDD